MSDPNSIDFDQRTGRVRSSVNRLILDALTVEMPVGKTFVAIGGSERSTLS